MVIVKIFVISYDYSKAIEINCQKPLIDLWLWYMKKNITEENIPRHSTRHVAWPSD